MHDEDLTLWYVYKHQIEKGKCPSFREIVEAGVVSSVATAHWHFRILSRLGFLDWVPGGHRTGSITRAGCLYLRNIGFNETDEGKLGLEDI